MGELEQVLRCLHRHEGIVNVTTYRHRAERDGSVGELLRDVDQVRGNTECGCASACARATKPRNDLIKDQQDVVLRTDFTQPL